MDKFPAQFTGRNPWIWILMAAGAIFYIPFLGGVHLFDWDEVNFAEISREMIATGDYLSVQVNYKPFFEKPPLFFWLQTLSMHLCGINEFAARLPNAIGGILVLGFIFKLGAHWTNHRFGLWWALSYLGSVLPLLYHKSGIIDPWFNLFIFASIASWIEGTKKNHNDVSWFFFSGILSGLAVLTKGPVGPLIIGLAIISMRFFSKNKNYLRLNSLLLFLLGNILIGGIWFGIEWLMHGPAFIAAFIKYQIELLSQSVAGHKGFPGYHFVVALAGIFPASIFALEAFRKRQTEEIQSLWELRLFMLILTFIVLGLFTLVQSKIVHYSSLAYYPVTFLSAWTIVQLLDKKIKWNTAYTFIGICIASVLFLALVALPLTGLNMDFIKNNFQSDPFTRAALGAEVSWDYFDFLPAVWLSGLLVFVYVLFRKFKTEYALLSLFAGIAILVNLFLFFFIGKIESYSQRAAIDFCKSKEGQQVDISTLGYHSYVPFFYAKKPVPSPDISSEEIPHYFILKADKRHLIDDRPDLKLLYEKNGFIFLERKVGE